MTIAGGLYALALASKEAGIMAKVMVGGLLWPHRRSIGSVIRKISVLVTICIAYLGFQFVGSSGVAQVARDPEPGSPCRCEPCGSRPTWRSR